VESLEWDDEFFKMSGTGYRSRYSHTQYPRARFQIQEPPDNEFEVEKIVGERWTKDGKELCLRWLHFKPKYDTWEPAGSISAEPKSGDGLISMWNRREDQGIHPRANKRQKLNSRRVQLEESLSSILLPPVLQKVIGEYDSYEDCVLLLPELLRPEQRREYYFT
jgi:hypothetical protein